MRNWKKVKISFGSLEKLLNFATPFAANVKRKVLETGESSKKDNGSVSQEGASQEADLRDRTEKLYSLKRREVH